MSSRAHRVSGASFEMTADLPMSMPEVDLLPDWYPQLWRRRRWLALQWWLTVVLVVVLLAVLVWRRAHVEATHVELASIELKRRTADATLSEVVAEEGRLSSLERQAEQVARMGLPLEVSRVMAEIDTAAPSEIALSLVEARIDTRTVEARRSLTGSRPPPTQVREMQFTLRGLAEKRETPYAFAESLRRWPLLREVKVTQTQAERVYGRLVEVFEIRFRVDLSPAGGVPGEDKGVR